MQLGCSLKNCLVVFILVGLWMQVHGNCVQHSGDPANKKKCISDPRGCWWCGYDDKNGEMVYQCNQKDTKRRIQLTCAELREEETQCIEFGCTEDQDSIFWIVLIIAGSITFFCLFVVTIRCLYVRSARKKAQKPLLEDVNKTLIKKEDPKEQCYECEGTGSVEDKSKNKVTCERCGGVGKLY